MRWLPVVLVLAGCGGDDDIAASPDASPADAHVDPGLDIPVSNHGAEIACRATFFPDPGELSDRVVTLLTPPVTPFTFTALSYYLFGANPHDLGCNLMHDQTIELWVAAEGAPEASPILLDTLTVSGAPDAAERRVDLSLPTPITVQAGQALFVAIGTPQVSTSDRVCLRTCVDDVSIPDRDFYSTAAAPPLDWRPLLAGARPMNVALVGTGFSAAP